MKQVDRSCVTKFRIFQPQDPLSSIKRARDNLSNHLDSAFTDRISGAVPSVATAVAFSIPSSRVALPVRICSISGTSECFSPSKMASISSSVFPLVSTQ